MTEGRGGAENYNEACERLLNSLHELDSALRAQLGSPYKYRSVSQAQSSPAARAYYLWANAGQAGPPPVFDPASVRAVIYNQAVAARQLEAFLHVSRVVAFELCQACIRGFEAKEIAVPCMMLRSLVERVAHVTALADVLKSLSYSRSHDPTDPNNPLLALGERVGKALYGTKIDWQKLRNVDPRAAAKDEIAYVRKELTMDVSARSVLAAIDKLDKRVPGTRIAYDTLCEFLHPNVGDLYSATVRASSQIDAYGTRHITRELGLGSKGLSTSPDLEKIMSQILAICCDVLLVLPLALNDLQAIAHAVNKITKKSAHYARKRLRSQFQNNDLCPCLSGLRVRDCK